MTDTAAPSLRPARTFFGEPPALGYLAFTEAWERFSYYGMVSLLVLYMSQFLFLPEHAGNIAGFTAFRAGLESVFGKMSTLALASQVYGLYTAGVYLTPIFGGLIADRLIGRRRAVMAGAVLMSGGHIAMAFDQSFLLALVLLVTGCGLLKGNISTQVGQLYREDDVTGRARGFSIFSMGINVGAVAGPIVCGYLGYTYGWHWGFGLAGVLMLLGLATYIAGYRLLTETTMRHPEQRKEPLTGAQVRVIFALFAVMALTIFQSAAFYQNSNIGLIWIKSHVELTQFGFAIPPPWFNAINSFISILSVPMLFALWGWQQTRGGAPGEIAKIATGAFITVAANLVLAAGSLLPAPVSPLFPVCYEALLGVGFLYYWPTLLALVSRQAPPSLKATLMGCVFLTLSISNLAIGRLGALYERLTPAQFWTLEAGIALAGGLLALLLRRPLSRLLSSA
ncbi:MAG TPA: peptide MFS transporter [Rhizomicrobium sp.]|jgi:POT family proton-dependent oligopeptide transporter